MKWVYRDCKGNVPVHLFSCDASDIFRADNMLKDSLGVDASKHFFVSVFSPDWMVKQCRLEVMPQ